MTPVLNKDSTWGSPTASGYHPIVNDEADDYMSTEADSVSTEVISENGPQEDPKDRFYLVHSLFLLVGLMQMLPSSFFITASGFWMYKFRNATDPNADDATTRTDLQRFFTTGCTILGMAFSVSFVLLSSLFGHKVPARFRLLTALGVLSVTFVVATAFVLVDTDSWQTGFFVLTMAMVSIINGANGILEVVILVILAKFPQSFMKGYIIGQGAGLLSFAILQVICLAIVDNKTGAALVYFICGTFLMTFTFTLFYLTKYNSCFKTYFERSKEDTTKKMLPLAEVFRIIRMIWSILALTLFLSLTLACTRALMPLVVSEYQNSGSVWNKTYFVPVITFVYSDVVALLGRFLSANINKSINGIILSIGMFLRMIVFVLLIMFCNIPSRHHLPIGFPHDWQYIIIAGVYGFSNGFLGSFMFLDIRRLVPPEKVEDAFVVLIPCSSVLSALLTPITIFLVKAI